MVDPSSYQGCSGQQRVFRSRDGRNKKRKKKFLCIFFSRSLRAIAQ